MRLAPLTLAPLAALFVASSCSSSGPPGASDASGGGAMPRATGDGGSPGSGTGAASSATAYSVANLYRPATASFNFEIVYATGAAPYTGSTLLEADPWNTFEANVNALFSGAGKTFSVPHTLEKMKELTDVTGDAFDANAIFAIAEARRTVPPEGPTSASFFVEFLPGVLVDEQGTKQPDVLGVSFGDTRVIAMFKPVIARAGGGGQTSKALEQTTLVHEFGHAVGLVDNGVALASAHEDAAHPKHCANRKCIMYWANEGASGATSFVGTLLGQSAPVVYQDDCLSDARAIITKGGN